MRGYLQATLKECRKALASHNTGLHARARVDEARRFMGETASYRESETMVFFGGREKLKSRKTRTVRWVANAMLSIGTA